MKNEKLKEILKEHYLPWFITSSLLIGIIIIISLIGSKNDPNLKSIAWGLMFVFFIFVFTMTLVLGGIFLLHSWIYTPWRKKKLLTKKAMLGFENLGFKKDYENMCYSGYLKDFYMTLNPITTATSGEWINANVFVLLKDSEINNIEIFQDQFDFNFSDGLCWVTEKVKIRFNKELDLDKIRNQLENFVDRINGYKIDPLIIVKN